MASSPKLVVAITVVVVLCHGYFEVVADSFEVRLNNTAPRQISSPPPLHHRCFFRLDPEICSSSTHHLRRPSLPPRLSRLFYSRFMVV
jgi:hypothetical protein